MLRFLEGPLGTPPPDIAPNSAGVELTFTVVCAGVVAIALVAALVQWRRGGGPVGVLLVIGGTLACIQEPMVDTLGDMYIPPSHFTLFESYGRELPWFAPFGYGLYFGIPMLVAVNAARRGTSLNALMLGLVGCLALELTFELVALHGGFYVYYGDQPLRFFDLPVHWMLLNMAAAWAGAAAVYVTLPHLRGPRILAVPVIAACAITASYYAQGWPIFTMLHVEGASRLAVLLGSLASIGLGISLILICARVLSSSASAPYTLSQATSRVSTHGREQRVSGARYDLDAPTHPRKKEALCTTPSSSERATTD